MAVLRRMDVLRISEREVSVNTNYVSLATASDSEETPLKVSLNQCLTKHNSGNAAPRIFLNL